jgi:FkbM family methyltransferase
MILQNEFLIEKITKFIIALETPGAWKARFKGCYFDMYKLVYDIQQRNISPRTVLDIGASRGMFTKSAHLLFPDATFYAFEPLTDCFESLQELRSQIHSLHPFNVALGKDSASAWIFRSEYEYSSSLLEMEQLHKEAFPYTERTQKIPVRMETLDKLLSGKPLTRPVLMKLDVQGSEMAVFEGARKTLECTDLIVCEVAFKPLYVDQPLFHDVYSLLVDRGFDFCGQLSELKNPMNGETLQIDALFLRRG